MSTQRLMLAAFAAAAALSLVSCSSDSDNTSAASIDASSASAPSAEGSGSGSIAAAKAACDAAKELPSATDLGTPIDVKPLAGKTVYSIPIDVELEWSKVGEQAMQAVAEGAGLKFVTFPSDGSPASVELGFRQAIDANASAIVLNGPLPETLSSQLDEAAAAGIPVIPVHISDHSEPALPNLPYEAFAPFQDSAELMAYCAIADLDGKPLNALIIEASETGPSAGMVKAMQNIIAATAPVGSTTTVIDSQVGDWSTEVQPAVESALLADPGINIVLPIFDSMALFAAPGIQQAAPDRSIGIYSFNGTPAVMELIPEGVVRVDVAENPHWVAHVNIDAVLRAMLKAPPSIPGRNPIRVIDASNVAETGNPPQFDQGFGDEYPAAYQRLWGLG